MGAGYKSGLFFYHKDDKIKFRLPLKYPARLSYLQSALGISQLRKLSGILEERHTSVRRYAGILTKNSIDLEDCRVQEITLRFSLLLKERKGFMKRWGFHLMISKWFDQMPKNQ